MYLSEPLLGNSWRDIHRDWRVGFMKYAIEVGSGAMIYIPSFIKIGSGIQKLMEGGGYTDTERRLHEPTLGKQANKIVVLIKNAKSSFKTLDSMAVLPWVDILKECYRSHLACNVYGHSLYHTHVHTNVLPFP
jgi:hypothetical protein